MRRVDKVSMEKRAVSLIVRGAALLLVVGRAAAGAPLDAERMNGTYVMKDGPSSGELKLELLAPNKLHVDLDLSFIGPVTASTGVGKGDATVKGNLATLAYKFDWAGPCTLRLSFEPGNTVTVKQQGDSADCGFGNHVMADGTYVKVRGGKPSRKSLPSGPNPDPASAALVIEQADIELAQAAAVVAARRPRIDSLATERKALQNAVAGKKRDFETHARAGAAAEHRFRAAAAAAKPPVKPTVAELRALAETEYRTALAAGKELNEASLRLRAVEDELVQLVADAKQAATDAKLALDDRRKAVVALEARASADSAEAAKSASAAQQEAGKARQLAGGATPEVLQAKRETARSADAKLEADTAAARSAFAALPGAAKKVSSR